MNITIKINLTISSKKYYLIIVIVITIQIKDSNILLIRSYSKAIKLSKNKYG